MSKPYKPPYVKKILISQKKIERSIKKAAKWLDAKFANTKDIPICVSVLKGSIPFYAVLVHSIHFDMVFDFVLYTSFKGQITRASEPEMPIDLIQNVEGKDVIVVEDIVDSGRTLSLFVSLLKKRKARSVTVLVLVDKVDMRKTNYNPDYSCFKIHGDPFIVGYGLDVKEKARNLPYIAEFDKSYIDRL